VLHRFRRSSTSSARLSVRPRPVRESFTDPHARVAGRTRTGGTPLWGTRSTTGRP
jgi:hypothetical protein